MPHSSELKHKPQSPESMIGLELMAESSRSGADQLIAPIGLETNVKGSRFSFKSKETPLVYKCNLQRIGDWNMKHA